MSSADPRVDPTGPVFVSYRQNDGTSTAVSLAWLLRAAGMPVWHDQTDLPPGDTSRRLAEALARGLSGAILSVTPDIVNSQVVRTVELNPLLDMEKSSDFVLGVGNRVKGGNGKVDYTAPDRLLGKPAGTLSRLDQTSFLRRDGMVALVRKILLHRCGRLAANRPAVAAKTLSISVQSRALPHANDRDTADLSVRLRPSQAGRLPSQEGLKDLASTLPFLPEALSLTGANAVTIKGGAHLSVALALGAALPTTLIGQVDVIATDGQTWTSGTVSRPVSPSPLTLIEGHGMGKMKPTGQRRQVLSYVDLLPLRSDAAYTRLLEEHPGAFDAWQHLRPVSGEPLDPADADRLVTEIAGRLRDLSQTHDNADLHLLLRTPFPVAVLLGRLLNTLKIVAYEWSPAPDDAADARPQFVPAAELRPTDRKGPITAVLIPRT